MRMLYYNYTCFPHAIDHAAHGNSLNYEFRKLYEGFAHVRLTHS